MPELFTETDWKLFKNKIGIWQNAYMEKLNRQLSLLYKKDRIRNLKHLTVPR